MITLLKGVLLEKEESLIVVEVHGIGYEVEVPLLTFRKLPLVGEAIVLYTHYFIREDAHILYGFSTHEERSLFRQLIKVNGVGPRLAMSVLSHLSVDEFVRLIHTEKLVLLTKIPGIGKKTAERLVIELRDKLSFLFQSAQSTASANTDATTALVSLGFKREEAAYLVARVERPDLESGEMIKRALRQAVIKSK